MSGFQLVCLNFPVVSLVSQLNMFEISAGLSIVLDQGKNSAHNAAKLIVRGPGGLDSEGF